MRLSRLTRAAFSPKKSFGDLPLGVLAFAEEGESVPEVVACVEMWAALEIKWFRERSFKATCRFGSDTSF